MSEEFVEKDYEKDLPPVQNQPTLIKNSVKTNRKKRLVLREDLMSTASNPKVSNRVYELCGKFPSCTGDYRILLWRYLREYHGCSMSFKSLKPFFDALREAPSPETIGRAYRYLVKKAKDDYAAADAANNDSEKMDAEERLKVLLPRDLTQFKRHLNERVYRELYGVKKLDEFIA